MGKGKETVTDVRGKEEEGKGRAEHVFEECCSNYLCSWAVSLA